MMQKDGLLGILYLDHTVKALRCKCAALQIDKNRAFTNLKVHTHGLWCRISCKAKKHAKKVAFLNRELAEYISAQEKIERGDTEEAVRILDKLLREIQENPASVRDVTMRDLRTLDEMVVEQDLLRRVRDDLRAENERKRIAEEQSNNEEVRRLIEEYKQ